MRKPGYRVHFLRGKRYEMSRLTTRTEEVVVAAEHTTVEPCDGRRRAFSEAQENNVDIEE